VFIETVIMEVNLERDATVGVSFHGVAGTADNPVVFGSQPEGAISSLSLKGLAAGSGLLAGIQGPVLTQVSKVLGFDISQFGLVLQALQLSSDVNVLSTPHILATDNREAEITVGQRIPFQTGANPAALQSLLSSGNASTASTLSTFGSNVTRERVELKLIVKPHIGEGDHIRLEINQSAEELAGQNSLGPITSTRTQKTQVVARNEETVVLGGIMQDRVIESVSKTPFLGDIPLLGALFRYTSKKKTKVNLLVFLTPHIIRDASDFRRVLDRKMAERKKIMEQFYGDTPEYEAAIDYTRKPGPLAAMAQAIAREQERPENGGHGSASDAVIAPSAK
jgi:general secretion pathway protein D